MSSPQIRETPRSNAHHVTQAVHDRAAAPKIRETPKACVDDGASCRAETCRLMPAVGSAAQNLRPFRAEAELQPQIVRNQSALLAVRAPLDAVQLCCREPLIRK